MEHLSRKELTRGPVCHEEDGLYPLLLHDKQGSAEVQP